MDWIKQYLLAILFSVASVHGGEIVFQDPLYVGNAQDWYLDRMGVTKAWSKCLSGKGVVIGVVDRGVYGRHPDLIQNYDASLAIDVQRNLNSADPVSEDETHGTMTAGVIAAAKNSYCGVGIAYEATITGIRLFGRNLLTDSLESRALGHRLDRIDIFSNSWGPPGNGQNVAVVGPMTTEAIQKGITTGRNGKGSIYVFAAGNGGIYQDSCAYDGYVNDIRTIAVTAAHKNGRMLQASEKCSAIFVTAFSRSKLDRNFIVTATGENGCSGKFGKTSAAAPQISAVIALALQANPNLSWRDVQHLLARSSDHSRLRYWEENTKTNAAGFVVSDAYGFGLLNAERMVDLASRWKNVGSMRTCTIQVNSQDNEEVPGTFESYFTCKDMHHIEHVELSIDLTYCVRGYVKVTVTSPQNTESVILPGRLEDFRTTKLKLTADSVHFWGENPSGLWTVKIEPIQHGKFRCRGSGTLRELKLKIHGTNEKPGFSSPTSRLRQYCPIKKDGETENGLRLQRLEDENSKLNLQIEHLFHQVNELKATNQSEPTKRNTTSSADDFSTVGCNSGFDQPITGKILKARQGQSKVQLGITSMSVCKQVCTESSYCKSITFIDELYQLKRSGEWEYYGQRCYVNTVPAESWKLGDPPKSIKGSFTIVNKIDC